MPAVMATWCPKFRDSWSTLIRGSSSLAATMSSIPGSSAAIIDEHDLGWTV